MDISIRKWGPFAVLELMACILAGARPTLRSLDLSHNDLSEGEDDLPGIRDIAYVIHKKALSELR